MQQEHGKFILFDIASFASWLDSIKVARSIRLIQNHHTFIPAYKEFNGTNQFHLLDAMEQAHLQRGFDQIAQNLTTFPDGTLAVCRAFDVAPAGIKGVNSHALCIENLGNFDVGQDTMADVHRATIVKLNALLCRAFSLRPGTDTIVFHHWFDLNTGAENETGPEDGHHGPHKSCPGTAFFGGNTIDSSAANFIPLVSAALAEASNPEEGA